jgi:hypothetical protein
MRSSSIRGLGLLVAALSAVAAMATAPGLAEVIQERGIRVRVEGSLSPTRLPRRGTVPVAVSVSGRIAAVGTSRRPQLELMTIAINREGSLATLGLPLCRLGRIDPATSEEALQACGDSLIGRGTFSADVELPEQSPFPSRGTVLAFNGKLNGRPAILAHIYGDKPVPTSYVLPFVVSRAKGTFGTVLKASLPRVTGEWGFVTGLSIRLHRLFSFHGDNRSFATAGCPAPVGFQSAVFPLMKTTFTFEGGVNLSETLIESCKVRD